MAEEHNPGEFIETAEEVAYALGRLDQLIQQTQEIEQYLADKERKYGIAPDRAKPITERMAAFGANQETIDSVAERLDGIALRFDRKAP